MPLLQSLSHKDFIRGQFNYRAKPATVKARPTHDDATKEDEVGISKGGAEGICASTGTGVKDGGIVCPGGSGVGVVTSDVAGAGGMVTPRSPDGRSLGRSLGTSLGISEPESGSEQFCEDKS